MRDLLLYIIKSLGVKQILTKSKISKNNLKLCCCAQIFNFRRYKHTIRTFMIAYIVKETSKKLSSVQLNNFMSLKVYHFGTYDMN